jgi:hypothetical protein
VNDADWWKDLNILAVLAFESDDVPTFIRYLYISTFVSRTSKMSVIIRLQNLPWSANALDIRQYFRGLSIPEGGVHIVGGEQGDAFIAFR